MSIFARKPEPEPITNGIDKLRRALKNRNSKINASAGFARDMNIAITRLDEFMKGADTLTPPELQSLCGILFPNSMLDADGAIVPANPQPSPPPPVMPAQWRHPNAAVAEAYAHYLQVLKDAQSSGGAT